MRIIFQQPEVRDLAWVMLSPCLLSDSLDVVADNFCQSLYEQNRDWLQFMDKNPEPLIEWLRANKSHRLGYYFEHLVAFWLQQRIAKEYFASHVRVFEEKRTIGEFDFLFKTNASDQLIHWETAVKFYLHYQARDEKVWWYGPNAQDRLDIKLDRVFNHQLKLGESPQGRALLKEKGFENVRSQTFFKGYLFYPVASDWKHPHSLPDAIARGHLKGWWTNIDTLTLPSYQAGDRWVVLSRLQWLAPKFIQQEQASSLMDSQQLIGFLKQHFKQRQQALLLAQMVPGENAWHEKTRGFVVGSTWPDN